GGDHKTGAQALAFAVAAADPDHDHRGAHRLRDLLDRLGGRFRVRFGTNRLRGRRLSLAGASNGCWFGPRQRFGLEKEVVNQETGCKTEYVRSRNTEAPLKSNGWEICYSSVAVLRRRGEAGSLRTPSNGWLAPTFRICPVGVVDGTAPCPPARPQAARGR